MIPKPLDAVTATDLQLLVDDEVPEQRTIEYKQKLPEHSDKEKKEFLADVSSFANAGGGDLIYGVVAKDGIPKSILGLADFNEDKERLRLEDSMRNGLEPRIPGIQLKAIQGFPNGPVLVLRVPRSWAAPHMVTLKRWSRFYSRSSTGKFQMDVTELRFAFETAGDLPERIRRWRDERLGRIVANEGPMLLSSSACIVVHLIPLDSFTNHWQLEANKLAGIDFFSPLGSDYCRQRLNVDGLLKYNPFGGSNHAVAYTQLFRSGRIESVNAHFLRESEGRRLLPGMSFESQIIESTENYLRVLCDLSVEPPIVFLLSIIGAKGSYMEVSPRLSLSNYTQHPIDRDVLILPDVLIEKYDCDVPRVLQPAFDAVWNACGIVRSVNFDEDGNWNPQR